MVSQTGIANTSTFNSLPRRSNLAFQRNTPARRSAGPLEGHIEYFVPRSVSEFNLAGVGDIALPMHVQQIPVQRRSPPPSILSHTRSTGTIMIPIQEMQHQHHQQQQQMHAMSPVPSTMPPMKPREKMVTFEDETKCLHGVPTTPRKSLQLGGVNDVFM